MRKLILVVLLIVIATCWGGWTLVESHHEDAWLAVYDPARLAFSSQHYSQAEEALVPLLPQAERWWPHGSRFFKTMLLLGMTYRVEHKYDQAKPLLDRAWELSSTIPSIESTDRGRVKLGLAVIARDKPDDIEAKRLFTEALAFFEKNPGAAEGDDGSALFNLGFICSEQGRYSEAESFLQRALVSYRTLLGSVPHPDFANAYSTLGEVYLHQSRFAEAAEQYQKAVDMYEKIEGPNGKNVDHALKAMLFVEGAQGKTSKERQLLGRAQEIERHLSSQNSNIDPNTLNNFGLTAIREGKYSQAESFFKQAIVAFQTQGQSDRSLAVVLANLGRLYRDHDQFDIRMAESPLAQALAIQEKAIGVECPETVKIVSEISLLYFYERNFAEAEKFAMRALPVQEKIFGENGLEVSTTLNRLGISERDLGKFPQAEANLRRALDIREKVLAPNHPWIATSLENLASVYAAEGKNEKVASLLTRARGIRAHPSGD